MQLERKKERKKGRKAGREAGRQASRQNNWKKRIDEGEDKNRERKGIENNDKE